MRFDIQSSGIDDLCEKENMHQNRIQSKGAKSLRRILAGARMRAFRLLRRSHWVWLVLCPLRLLAHKNIRGACRGKATSIAPLQHKSNVNGQGIGGCALNPRLLFPNTPGHPEAKSRNQPRDLLSRMYKI
jgi:hypothetical protein